MTLSQIHLKLQEICKEYNSLPIHSIAREMGEHPDLVIHNIDLFIHLSAIDHKEDKFNNDKRRGLKTLTEPALCRLHTIIHELDERYELVPVAMIVEEFGETYDFTFLQIELLMRLGLIDYANYEQDKIRLTEKGRTGSSALGNCNVATC